MKNHSYCQGKRNGEFAAIIALMESAQFNENLTQAKERAGNIGLQLEPDANANDYGQGECDGIRCVFDGLTVEAT